MMPRDFGSWSSSGRRVAGRPPSLAAAAMASSSVPSSSIRPFALACRPVQMRPPASFSSSLAGHLLAGAGAALERLVHEDVVGLLIRRAERLALALAERLGAGEQAAVRPARQHLGLDAELVVHAAQGHLAADDADRAGDRARLGVDLAARPWRCSSRRWRPRRTCWRGPASCSGGSSFQIRSLARADPPGLSTRRTMALTVSSFSAWRMAAISVSEPTDSPPMRLMPDLPVTMAPLA